MFMALTEAHFLTICDNLLYKLDNFARGPSLKEGGWIYLTGEGCWYSGGGCKSRWILIIFLINHAVVEIKMY